MNGSAQSLNETVSGFAVACRFLLFFITAAMTISCVSNPPRTDVTHIVKPGEDFKSISTQYTGTPDHYKAIAARSGVMKLSSIKPGDSVVIPANLVNQGAGNSSPSRAKTDTARTLAEAVAVATALGAGAGAIGCKNNKSSCAATGAGIGALTGLLAGTAVVMAKQAFVTDEERLNQEITHAKEYNKELKAHNLQLTNDVKKLTAESNSLKQRVRRGQAQADQLAAQKQKVSGLLASNQKLLTDSRTELGRQEKIYSEFKSGKIATNPETEKLMQEITVLKTNITKLDGETKKLAAVNDRLSV